MAVQVPVPLSDRRTESLYGQEEDYNMRLVHFASAVIATVFMGLLALALTFEAVIRPYGVDIKAFTSDSTYFDWNPTEALGRTPSSVCVGRQRPIVVHLPENQPWMAPIAEWAEPIMRDGATTLDRVDSLLAWWHGRFASYPMLSDAFPGIVPLDVFRSKPDGPALCGSQAYAFQIILTSRGITARWAFLDTNFGAPGWAGHSALEAWIPERQKWVYVDPMFGVRYLLDGEPLSLRELAMLRHERRFDELVVHHTGRLIPFPDYSFDYRFMGRSDMRQYFNSPGVWYHPWHLSTFTPGFLSSSSTRYYLAWSPEAGPFEPIPSEVRKRYFRTSAAVGAWALAAVGAWAAVRLRRRSARP